MRINLQELQISELKTRHAVTDALIPEIKGPDSSAKVDVLTNQWPRSSETTKMFKYRG